jgi:TPR repeat protein
MPSDHQNFLEGDAAEDAGDFGAARRSFERGAAQGDPFCWARLGLMFDNGIGCDVDKIRAMQYYKRGWRARDVVAANNIAVLHREAGNRRAMFQWFKRAADAGDDGALIEVAKCFLSGVGVRRNPTEGKASLTRAMRGSLSEAEREEAETILTSFRR